MTDNHTNDEQIEEKDTGTQGDQSAQDSTQKTVTIGALQEQIQMLQKQLEEQGGITKRAQYDYINLKMDFDRWSRQKDEEAKTAHIDTLIDVVKKFLPFVEDLRKSLENISPDHKEDPLTKGVEIVYSKFLQTLSSMKVKPIESIGQTPDSYMHDPVSMQPTDDDSMKGKIIAEFAKGFIYDDGQTKKVITASKVVIGQ